MKSRKKPPPKLKGTHGGARRRAGRKPSLPNKLTLRLNGEQRRTREPRAKMLMRLVMQGRVRAHKLTTSEKLRLLKEAAILTVRPIGYVRVPVHCVNGRFAPVGRATEDPLSLALEAIDVMKRSLRRSDRAARERYRVSGGQAIERTVAELRDDHAIDAAPAWRDDGDARDDLF